MKNILKNNMLYIILFIVFFGVTLSMAGKVIPAKRIEVRKASSPILPLKEVSKTDASYSIEELNKNSAAATDAKVTDLESLYKNYPKERAGDNMIEAWAKVAPEDKSKFVEGLDDTIKKSEEAIKVNPADKRAKSKLAISSMMKKLAMSNFNCKFENDPAKK